MKRKQNRRANLIREDSHLPAETAMPNAMSLSWSYEEHRDLVTSMTYKRGTTVVATRGYTYDNIGRPITRETIRQGNTVNDTFTYNSRSELIGATVSGKTYDYSYDNIGNRKTAQEDAEEVTAYTDNPLNQYTAIQQGEEASFTPTYDADGNQTRIRTATGIWNVTYNAENRPIRFESADGSTVVECTYDYMGRRHTRKVTANGTVNSYLRYIYRGYLQIAAIDAVSGVFRWFLVWDSTQPEATRPLAIRKDGTWYAYGWDLTGNVTEIFGKAGYLRTAYTYTPYGTATADGDVTQPLTWSSEYTDEELALIYYNYRHYNPHDGRWICRDPIAEQGGVNLYAFVRNDPAIKTDIAGKVSSDVTSCCLTESIYSTELNHKNRFPAKREINNSLDALSHFKSNVGGKVPAGEQLIKTIKESPGYRMSKKSTERNAEEKIKLLYPKDLCNNKEGQWRNSGGWISFYTWNNAVGNVSFYVEPYVVYWTALKICNKSFHDYITRKIIYTGHRYIFFEDNYVFDESTKKIQYFTDEIPSWIARDGTPYTIYGSFEDRIQGSFDVICFCGNLQ